jgi:YjbE family integral membrane protein
MPVTLDLQFAARVLQIVFIDILLAGDNAVVIALAVHKLPPRQQFLGRVFGTGGAVVLRLAFIAVVTYLLGIPLLQFVGGLLLLWIALKLMRPDAVGDHEVESSASLWRAVWIIVVADMTMSLDNVIAVAGAAGGNLFLVAFGIALSIPLVVWGSGVLARLMSRYTWIVWLGGGILGYVGATMMLGDSVVRTWLGSAFHVLHYPVSLLCGAALFAIGWWLARRTRVTSTP